MKSLDKIFDKLSIREMLERAEKEDAVNSEIIVPQPVNGFYIFPMSEVRKALSNKYLEFLRDSGYAPNLNNASELRIAKNILKIDANVRNAASQSGLTIGNDGEYLVSINHTNGKKIVEAMGYKLSTTAIMYRLFIPYIKEQAQQNNLEAQTTLNEMTATKAEWLEDLILNKSKFKIGAREASIALPSSDGRFDKNDINEYGYPTAVKQSGEFYYWHANGDERAAIRCGGAGLDLSLDWGPSGADGSLGARLENFFDLNILG